MSDDSKKLLRLAEIAKLFQVHPKTAYYWFRSGRLSGAQSPGGLIRVRPEDVVEMCRASDTPVPESLGAFRPRAHVVEVSKGALRGFVKTAKSNGFEVHTYGSLFDALLATGETPPALLVVEVTDPCVDIAHLVAALRRRSATRRTRVFAIAADASVLVRMLEAGLDGAFGLGDVASFGEAIGG